MRRIAEALVAGSLFVVATTPSAAASGRRDPVFLVVSKSENKNQVHYGIRVDAECRPSGTLPAFAFWRMFERGGEVVEGLLAREQGVYGISTQSKRTDTEVALRVSALPKRPLVVRPEKTAGGECRAGAFTTIAGVEGARLDRVHVELAWPFGVRHLVLLGRAPDGRALREISIRDERRALLVSQKRAGSGAQVKPT